MGSVEKTGIQRAVEVLGGQIKVAELLDITQQAVSSMVNRGYASARHVKRLAELSGVPAEELIRPDLLPLLQIAAA